MDALLRWFWRKFPALGRAFERKARAASLGDPRIAAKFYPYRPDDAFYLMEPSAPRTGDEPELPVPPRELWWGPESTEQEYFQVGRGYVGKMKAVLEAAGAPLESHRRILDFGCASGIMIRWLRDWTKDGEVWGVDLSGAHVQWCQRHLSPPFKFATTTSFPHLPFEDGTFDLIYAGSVFTHIADLGEAWLMELKRIVRPGGKLFLTINDEESIQLYLANPKSRVGNRLRAHPQFAQMTGASYDFFTVDRTPGEGGSGQAQVFYRRDYLRRHWGNYLKVVSITPQGYWYQTAFLLEK